LIDDCKIKQAIGNSILAAHQKNKTLNEFRTHRKQQQAKFYFQSSPVSSSHSISNPKYTAWTNCRATSYELNNGRKNRNL